MTQTDRAVYFRQLHKSRPLVLPNAWDAASARVIELANAQAIATTSAGVSWTCGPTRTLANSVRPGDLCHVIGLPIIRSTEVKFLL